MSPSLAPAHNELAQQLTALLLRGQRQEALAFCRSWQAQMGYVAVAVDLIQPALYAVGQLWATHLITVAEEHVASAVAGWVMGTLALDAPREPERTSRILLACVAGNRHSLGIQLLAEALEADGWDVISLGADVPSDDLASMIARSEPHAVGLSASLLDQLPTARGVIAEARRRLGGAGTLFAIGGTCLADVTDPLAVTGADRYFRDARDAVHQLGHLAPRSGGSGRRAGWPGLATGAALAF